MSVSTNKPENYAPTAPERKSVCCEIDQEHAPSHPLSPWLRIAHRRHLSHSPSVVPLRRILDFELLLVLEGDCWLWVEPAGGALQLGAGDMALIPPSLVHTWGESVGTHLAIHFDLCAQPDLVPLNNLIVLNKMVSYQPAKFSPHVLWRGFTNRTIPLIQHPEDIVPWQECLEKLIALSAGRTSAALNLDEQSAVQSQLLWALRAWIDISAIHISDSSPQQRIRDFLAQINPNDRNSIEELAHEVHMSSTTFRKAFHQVTGQSPHSWIEARRIDLAAHRLLHTNLPIYTIANDAGYPDPYHFSKVFKRVLGFSPRHYRQATRQSM